MEYTIAQKNNAITAFLGGPATLKPFFKHLMEEEFHLMGPEDLMFHTSWDWLMPVWKKLRKELIATENNGAMLFALSKALDEVEIESFHRIVSSYCIDWCKRKSIKL